MPELRKDPITGRWVIIATERARRPGTFVDSEKNYFEDQKECPFCNNQENPIYEVKDNSGNWRVKVVPSGTPLVQMSENVSRSGQGLYDVVNNYGVHEVIIETPEHIANMADLDVEQIKMVMETYVHRFEDLSQDRNMQYILAYKNYGCAAGSRRIGHSRSQIIATSVNPLSVKNKMVGLKRYFDYHDRCLYCDLISQERAGKDRVIVETDSFVAVTPFAPRFIFEIWIVPKKHHCSFSQGVAGKENELAYMLKEVLVRVKIGLEDPAYNFVIQTAPLHRTEKGNKWKTIEEDYHWHIEVMPRLTRFAGFEKGSGFYICTIPPESAAEYLREVEI